MNFVTTACNFATVAHHGMKYGDYTYIDGHLSPVALQARLIAVGLGLTDRDISITEAVAWLHDCVEDTNTTVEDIRRISDMPHEVSTSVSILTKKGCTSYSVYISLIGKSNDIYAIIVKLSDSICNYRQCISEGLIEKSTKYANNIQLLTYTLRRVSEERNKNRH